MTSDARGSVRVIRQGRKAFQAFLTPSSNVILSTGDLVIVDTANQKAGKKAGVEIALLNVIDRPVVLRVRDKHASLTSIVLLLGQPVSVANYVRVIRTSPRSSRNQRTRSGDGLLSRDVLVFDASMMKKATFPEFPKPYSLKQFFTEKTHHAKAMQNRSQQGMIITTGAIETKTKRPYQSQGEEISQVARLLEKQRVRELLKTARANFRNGFLRKALQQAEQARLSDVDFGLLEDRPELVIADVTKAMRSGTAFQINQSGRKLRVAQASGPAFGQRQQPVENAVGTNRNSSQKSSSRQLTSQPPEPFVSQTDVLRMPTVEEMAATDVTNKSLDTIPNESTDPESKAETPMFSTRMVVAMVVAFAVVIVSGLLLSMGMHKSSGQTTRTSSDASSLLEKLIRNELPLQEEHLTLPASIDLHGQIGFNKSLRIEEAHNVMRPHFQPRVSAEENVARSEPMEPNISAMPVNAVPEPQAAHKSEELEIKSAGRTGKIEGKHQTPPPHSPPVESSRMPVTNLTSRLAPSDAMSRALASLRKTPSEEGKSS